MATYQGKNISGGSVNVRPTAGTSQAAIGKISNGKTVTLSSYNDRWMQAQGGYVQQDFFHISSGGIGTGKVQNITTGTLNIRYAKDKGTSGNVIFGLKNGTSVTILESTSNWYKISCSSGTGFADAFYINATITGGETETGVENNGHISTKVTGTWLRGTPSNTAGVIQSIPAGTNVVYYTPAIVDAYNTSWYRIKQPAGYVYSIDVLPGSYSGGGGGNGTFYGGDIIKTSMQTYLRKGSGSQHEYIERLNAGVELVYMRSVEYGGGDKWYEAVLGNKTVGWIDAKTVKWERKRSTTAPEFPSIDDGSKSIKIGHYGTTVDTMRHYIRAHGESISSSGELFDTQMFQAVKNIQKKYGLDVDGIIGQTTFVVLLDDGDMSNWFIDGKQGSCALSAGKLARVGFRGKAILSAHTVFMMNEMINDKRFKFTTKRQIRHFLAHVKQEVGRGSDTLLQNPYDYAGAGIMQLTGKDNYDAFALWVGDPKCTGTGAATYVASDYLALSAGWHWQIENKVNNKLRPQGNWYTEPEDVYTAVKNTSRVIKGRDEVREESKWKPRLENYKRLVRELL